MNNIKKTLVLGTLATGLLFGTQAKASHKVEKGETLSIIANKYGKTLDEIVKINPQIYNIDLIFPNQEINVNEYKKLSKTVMTQNKYIKKPVEDNVQKTKTQKSQNKVYKNEVEPVGGSEESAKEWIAYKESRGDYNARSATGKYVGRYQLTNTYLNGDYSPENQERVVSRYIKERYGSWSKAKQFWQANGWY